MKNNYEIVQELKEEEKQGKFFSSTKESSNNSISTYPAQNYISDQNLDYECFKNFFDNAPIYEYMVSPEGTILEINKTALTNLGYKKEELIGEHLTVMYAPESHEKMKVLLSKWKETGEIDNEEMVIATKQGEKRIVLLSASSVRGVDGAILYSISVLKDVTDINKIYDDLNKNLWLQNIKLEKLNETKKTFLKTTSHELRTPITSIKGYVQMLMKKTLGEINEGQRKGLEVILRNTNRLDQVIQNILDASSLESGIMKFIPRKVNPRTLVEEITKTMEPFANKKEMTINVNLEKDLPDLMIDGERIKQVLMNLVDNAIKFSPDGSMIHVKARKEKEDVLFEVQDFGQGIQKDKQGMIFDTFYQADSGDDRLFGGAGLSLALSKGIVRLHGGNIWFESTEGIGSTFLFTLPIQSISDMENTDVNNEMPSENTSEESAGLAVNSVTLNTTDEDASGSITEYEKSTATPKENEERYRALFNSSFELMYLHDLKGNFIDANPTALKLLGYNKEDLGSLNFSSLLDRGQIWKAMKALNEIKKYGRQKEPTEFRLKIKNGTFIDVETTAELVYRDGTPYAIQGIARDITERKQAQKILKESVDKYRTLFEATPDLIVETDEKGILLAVNPAIAGHFGIPVEKLIGKNIFNILPKEVTKERAKIARKALKDGEIKINEDENAGRYFHNIYVPIIRPDGRKTLQLVARDITAAKKAEEEIRYLKEYNENILESNPNPILVIKGKQIEYVNRAFIFAFGETKKEYITRNLKEVIPSEVLPVFENLLQEDGGSKELKFRGKDFDVRSFVVKKAEEEEEEVRVGLIFQDITEQKQVEGALRESEVRFRELFNRMSSGVAVYEAIDNGGDFILRDFNPAVERIENVSRKDILGKRVSEAFPGVKAFGVFEVFQRVWQTGKPEYYPENIYKDERDPGSWRESWVFKLPTGEIVAIYNNITKRKQAEEELKESEEKFRDLFENANDLIQSADTNGRFIYVNKKWLRTLGYTEAEVKSLTITDILRKDQIHHCMEIIKEVSSGKSFEKVETVFVSKDGREIYVEGSANAKFKDGEFIATRGIFRDITERKKLEETLRLNEDKLRKVIDSSPDNITVSDLNGTIIDCNQATVDMHGFSKKEDIIGKNALELIALKDHEKAMKNLKKTLEVGPVKNVEYTFLKKDGSEFPVEMSASVITDPSGIPISFMGVIKDVSERKKVEQLLKESEEKFRTIFDNSTEGILLADMENKKFFTGNKTICNMLGYSVEEIKNLGVMEIHPKEDLPFVVEQFEKQARRESVLAENIPVKRKDGSVFYVEINSVPMTLAGKTYLVGAFRDITERKRAEKALKESEEKLRSIVENSSDQIFMLDKDYKFLSINKTAAAISRKSPQEIIGRSIFEIFPEIIAAQFSKNIKKVFDTGKSIFIDEKMVVQGRELYNSTSLNPIKDGSGSMIAVTGIVRDITEREQSEEAIRGSEERYRILFESSQDAIMTLEPPNWNFTTGNPAAIEMFKAKNEAEFTSNGPENLSPERQPDGHISAEKAKEMIETAMREGSCFFEWTHKRLDGTEFPATVLLTRMKIKGKQFLQATVRDITEQKRTQKEREKILLWQQGVNTLQLSLLTPAPLEDKLKAITDNVVRIFDADFCRIWLTQPGDLCEQGCIHAEVTEGPHVCRNRDRCLRLWASSGRYTHTDGKIHQRVPFGCYKIGRVASGDDHKFLTNDVQNDPRVHNNDWARGLGLVSFAGYQLRPAGGETTGVLALFAKHPIQQVEDTILDEISNTVARVVQQAAADERLRESTRKIETQNVQLQKLDKIKSSFLNITSHELRTPMSAIKGYIQMMLKGNLGTVNDEQKHALAIILRNSNRLDRLIQDILDISRLESGTMKFVTQKTDVTIMVNEIAEIMQASADLKRIKINAETGMGVPDLIIDKDRITQVVVNILNNAIKFSPDGSMIHIKVRKEKEDVLFEVQDYGRGIPEEHHKKIFQTFYQVDSDADTKFGGAGLGLAICYGIVIAHGGRIWVESIGKPGEGSIFRFTLPVESVINIEERFKGADVFGLEKG